MATPSARVTYHSQKLAKSGASVHYAKAGQAGKPIVLLLHGFPSSSNMYRWLIAILAARYNVYAPDLPGFGFTTLPDTFKYTFDGMGEIVLEWVDTLKIERCFVYMFDYGAPVAERLALARPELIVGIVSQNGNAYLDGLGPAWKPIQDWWKSGESHGAIRDAVRGALQAPPSDQYIDGTPADRRERLDPSTWTLDYLNNIAPRREIQLDLFFDYQNNLKLYPAFQEWMRTKKIPVLAIWGKNDVWFIPPGAEAFAQDVHAKVVLLDAGHFALETHLEEIATEMLAFLNHLEAK